MLDKKLLADLQEYIESHRHVLRLDFIQDFSIEQYSSECIQPDELKEFINKTRKPAFNEVLFGFIDRKGVTDSDIYKKAGIDRRHFSKIRTKPDYRIGKNTVIALALALELNKMETEELLNTAGYSFSDNDTFDLVIQFFLEKRIYDIDSLNQALDYFSLKPLPIALE